MTIYHGSDHIIEHPAYRAGKRHNDYGYGFYCTQYPDMAREWSVSRDKDGYVNKYELNTRNLSVLDLSKYSVLTWLTILLENRTFQIQSPLAKEACDYLIREFHTDYDSYDIIRGYRADDSYFSFALDFLNGTIPVSQLSAAMKLGEFGEQIVLRSEKAFRRITFSSSEETDRLVWYPKRMMWDKKAREAYYRTDKIHYVKGDIYITKILDEEIKKDDVRIF